MRHLKYLFRASREKDTLGGFSKNLVNVWVEGFFGKTPAPKNVGGVKVTEKLSKKLFYWEKLNFRISDVPQ